MNFIAGNIKRSLGFSLSHTSHIGLKQLKPAKNKFTYCCEFISFSCDYTRFFKAFLIQIFSNNQMHALALSVNFTIFSNQKFWRVYITWPNFEPRLRALPGNATIASHRQRQTLHPLKLLESNSNIFTISVFHIYLVKILHSVL